MYFSPVTQRASHQAGGGWEVSITAVWKAKMQKAASAALGTSGGKNALLQRLLQGPRSVF